MAAETSMRDARKRARSLSSSSSSGGSSLGGDADDSSPLSPSTSPSSRPAHKYHRAPSPVRGYLCTLPPTCSQPGKAQTFVTAAELESHQARLHQWVCRVPIRDKPGRIGEGEAVLVLPEQFAGRGSARAAAPGERWRECGKVFPDERLLDLHYTETHDAIARERLERGEKIFECFLPSDQCGRMFLTPKKRRRHLIDKHHYPVGYYFGITNHGLNQIARADGPAVSLIRPRRAPPDARMSEGGGGSSIRRPRANSHETAGSATVAPTTTTAPRRRSIETQPAYRPASTHHHAPPRPPDDMDIDDLTAKMSNLESSLAFVPRGVRRAAAAARNRETRAV